MRVARIIGLICLLSLGACSKQKEAAAATPQAAESAGSGGHIDISITGGPDGGVSFNEIRAMRYVKEIVAFGPRPLGSANHKKVEDYLLAHLRGDEVEDDSFTADTPEGKFPVHNIVAKFPGTKDGIIVIASHYDTN